MKIEPKESRMPSSIATSSPRGAATFFCRLEFIEIKGALGSSALRRDAENPTKIHTKTNSNRISRALDYVARAQMSVNPAEKVAFYCTALESLFSTSTSELTHQIAERVAVVTSQNAASRSDQYWFVKKVLSNALQLFARLCTKRCRCSAGSSTRARLG